MFVGGGRRRRGYGDASVRGGWWPATPAAHQCCSKAVCSLETLDRRGRSISNWARKSRDASVATKFGGDRRRGYRGLHAPLAVHLYIILAERRAVGSEAAARWQRWLPRSSELGSGSRVGRTCVPPGVFCAPLDLTAAVQALTTHARTHARGGATTSYSQQRVWPHMSRLRTTHSGSGCHPPAAHPPNHRPHQPPSPRVSWGYPEGPLPTPAFPLSGYSTPYNRL